MTDSPKNLTDLLSHKRICVVLGPGGVGKTTSSIAIAIMAARAGLNVGLLSIDPAKRLAAALGMSLSSELKNLDFGEERPLKGSLEAAMLDQKAVFDSMVKRHAKNSESADKILQHPLYQAASTKLAGPLEYMALAKLQEMSQTGKYDLIVLDTPPDTHALDFLKRPNILSGFMEHKVMSWMVKPFYIASRFGVSKLLSVGEKLMGGVAKVTGFAALSLFAEFLVLMQQVIDGFHQSGEEIVKLLGREDTSFFIVTTPGAASVRSTLNLADQLQNFHYKLDGVIVNKSLKTDVANSIKQIDKYSQDIDPSLVDTFKALQLRLKQESVMVKKLVNDLDEHHHISSRYITIEEQSYDLHSVEAIFNFSHLFIEADFHSL